MSEFNNCQICGEQTDHLHPITINENGLITHKLVCQKCYGILIIEQNKRPDNLLCE